MRLALVVWLVFSPTMAEEFEDVGQFETDINGDLIPAYNRDEYLTRWPDSDGNGCTLREELLVRDALWVRVGSDGCTVERGGWLCPYTGRMIVGDPRLVDVEHVVSLHDAHRSGAWAWPSSAKRLFAVDQENLLIVEANENRHRKSDKDLSEYLPSHEKRARDMAWRALIVKLKWGLDFDEDDREVLVGLLRLEE